MGNVIVWIIWFLAAAACLGTGIAVVSMTNPFYSALALIGNLASLAVLFLLLSAEFVAAAQVLVYAGAVMVMFLFVVAYLGGRADAPWAGGPPLLRGAAVVAAVALQRLGRSEVIAELLDPSVVVPQVGQGALAVECRVDDTRTRRLLAPIEHRASRVAVDAERAWLREVGSGCDLPVGAHATVADDGMITLTAMLGTLDGRVLLRTRGRGDDASELGSRVALELLDGAGGRALLSDLALEARGA